MDPSKSFLNPYAAPFVPFSSTAVLLEEGRNLGKLSCADTVDQGKSSGTCSGYTQCIGEPHVSGEVSSSVPSGTCDENLQASNSEKSSEEFGAQDMLEKFELVSELLCNEFPNLSKESIAEVFYANACDVEGTVNMLEDMEDLTFETNVLAGNPNTSGTGGVKDEA